MSDYYDPVEDPDHIDLLAERDALREERDRWRAAHKEDTQALHDAHKATNDALRQRVEELEGALKREAAYYLDRGETRIARILLDIRDENRVDEAALSTPDAE